MPTITDNRAMLGNSLFDYRRRWGVVSQWKFNGDGNDSVGSNALTNNNTATFGQGKIGQGTNLSSAGSQFWSIADNAPLSTGDVDFWGNLWVKLTDKPSDRALMTKWLNTGNQFEYSLYYTQADDLYEFNVTSTGAAASIVTVKATTFGVPPLGTWANIFFYHDSVANAIGIAVNGGAFNTTGTSAGVFDGTAPFQIGKDHSTNYQNGSVDNALFGKSPPGGFSALRTEIRDGLYNSGNGRESLIF